MRCLAALMALVVMVWSAPLQAQKETRPPLPGNLQIIPPGPGVAPRLAAMSGVWEGVLTGVARYHGKQLQAGQGGREVAIAIEKIDPPNVAAVFAWGGFGGKKEGFRRVKGMVSGESIILEWGEEAKVQVTLKPTGNPGLIDATWLKDNNTMTATLKKR